MEIFQVDTFCVFHKKSYEFIFQTDPTDCSKYHICNGSNHSIAECAASHTYSIDSIIRADPYYSPGSGEFSCNFQSGLQACFCDKFSCEGNPNTFVFGHSDRFHYAYCLEIGSMKKVFMYKCPPGTTHNFFASFDAATNSVKCLPVQTTVS